jgi:hypothetical protein
VHLKKISEIVKKLLKILYHEEEIIKLNFFTILEAIDIIPRAL